MKRPEESGFIMALALVLLVLGSVVIVPCITTASSALKINQNCETNTDAAYAAESGIQDVIWRFNNNQNPTFPYTLPNTINGLTVIITEAVPHTQQAFTITYILNSAAKQSSQPKGQIMVQILRNTGSSPFYYGIVALNGDVTMSNYSSITSTPVGHGDVYCNGSIHAYNSALISGNAAATGTIDSSHVSGTSSPGQPKKDFQPMDMTWYLNQANAGGTIGALNLWNVNNYNLGPKHITGDLTIGQSTVNLKGVVWVDGRVDINCTSTVTGTTYIVANGYIAVSNNCQVINNPTLISNNSYIMLSNSTAVGSLYAPNGTISISNYAVVNGSIVGKAVSMSNNAAVNYPLNLQTNPPPGFSGGSSATITSYAYY
jgi:hypothetical protein